MERTENGYSCIALCGALSAISNDLEAAAVILTEFADIKGAPQYLRPSLQQWHDMLKSCSGSLITTKFECIANQYMLLSGTRGKATSTTVGEPRDVALALDAIGRLSRGEIAAITLARGAICGWLAAFAHVFLDLEIELQDSDKHLVMKTVADNKRIHIIVLFGQVKSHDVQVSSTSYYIRDVQTFMKRSYSLQIGRVPWDEAIQRTFGSLGTELLAARKPFGTLIGCAARMFAAVADNDKGLMKFQSRKIRKKLRNFGMTSPEFCRNWIGYNTESFGRGYVNFAIERLHELNDLRDIIEPCLGYSAHAACTEYQVASRMLREFCSCAYCRSKWIDKASESSQCIFSLGEFIVILLWQLSLIDVSTMIQPTQRGLETLYGSWHSMYESVFGQGYGRFGNTGMLLSYLNIVTVHEAARYLFAGYDDRPLFRLPRLPESEERRKFKLFPAQESQGLCFFVDTLVKTSDRPETRKLLHILPGTIDGPSGTHFDVINDGDTMNQYQEEKFKPLQDYKILEKSSEIPLESKLLAQESLRYISASIQISGPKGNICIGPFELQQAIMRSVGLIQCSGRSCVPVTPPHFSNVMAMGDGNIARKPNSRPREIVILRNLAGNTLARCISVAMQSASDIDSFRNRFEAARDPAAILLRRDECIPCCINTGLSMLSVEANSICITL